MPKAPSKYAPLRAYLASQPADVAEVTLTFAELEAVLGASLPPTAWAHSWWGNNRAYGHARSWLDAGWHVTARSLRRIPPTVTFARGAPAARADFGRPSESTP